MMNQEEHIQATALNLKILCYGIIYVIMQMHTYLNRTITITGAGNDDAARQADERNKGVTFKN